MKNRRRRATTILEREPDETREPTGDERHTLLTGGDIDADWGRADASGEEAVGGSVATPDQDMVDEIGRALGVEIPDEEELRTTHEILHDRDRFRWHLERDAEDEAEGHPHHRRGTH